MLITVVDNDTNSVLEILGRVSKHTRIPAAGEVIVVKDLISKDVCKYEVTGIVTRYVKSRIWRWPLLKPAAQHIDIRVKTPKLKPIEELGPSWLKTPLDA